LFCSIRHPLIIAPIAAQRQAFLTERLRSNAVTKRPSPSNTTIGWNP